MSKKGFLTVILGGSALAGAAFTASTNAGSVAIVPIENTPMPVLVEPAPRPTRGTDSIDTVPTRPPGRSVYRPGPRVPPTVIE